MNQWELVPLALLVLLFGWAIWRISRQPTKDEDTSGQDAKAEDTSNHGATMDHHVTFNAPNNAATKSVKVGFAWPPFCVLGVAVIPLFFFAVVGSMMGTAFTSLPILAALTSIPLFTRRLFGSAVLWIVLWAVLPLGASQDLGYIGAHLFAASLFVLAMGCYANKLTAKRLLKNGWLPAEPESTKVVEALRRWDAEVSTPP